MQLLFVLFWLSCFVVIYAMVGYPIVLFVLDKLFKFKQNELNSNYEPTVSYMITAHNEEEVIEKKLENALELDYPKEKLEILVVLDNCQDKTESIVNTFIQKKQDANIRVIKSKKHLGKLNAQNEAKATITAEMIVMTDANSMISKNAIKELVSSFSSDDIGYVCGKLQYVNPNNNLTSDSESTYWNLELKVRDVESRLQTVANGNGALYACKTKDYVNFEPIRCHDSAMPYDFAMKGMRAIFNPNAIALEKASQSNEDEFGRKVRMNREYVDLFSRDLKTINFFKYKWFSFIYFGHKTCRHLIWLAHIVALLCSMILCFYRNLFGIVTFIAQVLALIIAFVSFKVNFRFKLFRLIGYYGMTIFAQIVAIYNGLTNKRSVTWEKVDSSRV